MYGVTPDRDRLRPRGRADRDAQAVGGLIGTAPGETVVVDAARWADLTAPVAPIAIDNPNELVVDGEVRFAEGEIELEADDVGPVPRGDRRRRVRPGPSVPARDLLAGVARCRGGERHARGRPRRARLRHRPLRPYARRRRRRSIDDAAGPAARPRAGSATSRPSCPDVDRDPRRSSTVWSRSRSRPHPGRGPGSALLNGTTDTSQAAVDRRRPAAGRRPGGARSATPPSLDHEVDDGASTSAPSSATRPRRSSRSSGSARRSRTLDPVMSPTSPLRSGPTMDDLRP